MSSGCRSSSQEPRNCSASPYERAASAYRMPSAYAASSSSCARARSSSRLRPPGRSRSRPEVMYAGRPIAASPRPRRPTRGNLAAAGQDRAMARTEEAQGQFTRDSRYITTRITADGRDGYPVEPGRCRLVVSRACPWASRAVVVRRLLGLEDVLSMGICGPTHDERSWSFDLDPGGRDPVLGIERLQQAYFARFPGYDRGITVPAMVDVPTGKVVTNDYAQLTLDLSTQWRQYYRTDAPDLYPEHLRDEMDEVMEAVFRDVNN